MEVLVFELKCKGGGFLKGKVLMLMFIVFFAAFTTLALVSSNIQMNKESSAFADSQSAIEVHDKLVQPCGLPIDGPGGPT